MAHIRKQSWTTQEGEKGDTNPSTVLKPQTIVR